MAFGAVCFGFLDPVTTDGVWTAEIFSGGQCTHDGVFLSDLPLL